MKKSREMYTDAEMGDFIENLFVSVVVIAAWISIVLTLAGFLYLGWRCMW